RLAAGAGGRRELEGRALYRYPEPAGPADPARRQPGRASQRPRGRGDRAGRLPVVGPSPPGPLSPQSLRSAGEGESRGPCWVRRSRLLVGDVVQVEGDGRAGCGEGPAEGGLDPA